MNMDDLDPETPWDRTPHRSSWTDRWRIQYYEQVIRSTQRRIRSLQEADDGSRAGYFRERVALMGFQNELRRLRHDPDD
jgi:hypothetical protein